MNRYDIEIILMWAFVIVICVIAVLINRGVL